MSKDRTLKASIFLFVGFVSWSASLSASSEDGDSAPSKVLKVVPSDAQKLADSPPEGVSLGSSTSSNISKQERDERSELLMRALDEPSVARRAYYGLPL